MHLEVSGKTHVGKKRSQNEDSFLLMPEEGLCCVADGMGGHSSGEIASKLAVSEVYEFFKYTAEDKEATWPFKADRVLNYDENRLATALKLANQRIYEASYADTKYRGMGTTIAAIYCVKDTVYIGHVGDSRIYHFISAKKELIQLTEDHSLLNDFIRSKKPSSEEIQNFPHKNIIVRALGLKDKVQVDINRTLPSENDLFLICSDGLSGMIPISKILEILSSESNLDAANEQLVDSANEAGGNDNITSVLARWHA
jgi:serine/threonine protein phosphatase PrpC